MTGPRLLVYDIETSPSVCYSFSMWQTNITSEKMIKPSEVMCFAAQWVGEDEVIYRSTHDDGRAAMVEKAHRLFSEADVLIGWNSIKFDTKHLNREFILAGLGPPAPYRQVDLMRAVKSRFNFSHNGLDYICSQLGLERKQKHGEFAGFDLWLQCLAGNDKAWKVLREYCVNDTAIITAAYLKLLPWVSGHPSWGAFLGEDVCVNCGSESLAKEGFAYTSTSRYQRLRCRSCGKYSRSTKKIGGTNITQLAG